MVNINIGLFEFKMSAFQLEIPTNFDHLNNNQILVKKK